jgi:hypothetical protein
MDALRANVVVGASQKGLMCPPGVGFVAADAAALEVASRNTAPRFYWDWTRRRSELSYRKFCGTAPQNLLMGLEAALRLIFHEGLDNVFARHRPAGRCGACGGRVLEHGGLAAVLRTAGGDALGFGDDDRDRRRHRSGPLADRGARTLPGRDRRRPRAAGGTRVSHRPSGDTNAATILGCLAGVEAAMTVQKIPYGKGGVEAALHDSPRAESQFRDSRGHLCHAVARHRLRHVQLRCVSGDRAGVLPVQLDGDGFTLPSVVFTARREVALQQVESQEFARRLRKARPKRRGTGPKASRSSVTSSSRRRSTTP